MRSNTRRLGPALLPILCAVAVLAVPAAATAAPPPKLTKPANAAVLTLGSEPTFKVRDASKAARKYGIFITISTSKKKTRTGALKQKNGTFVRAKRDGKVYKYTAPDLTFPEWFMMRPGTYYWQAERVDDSCTVITCKVFSKIRRFVVR